MGNIWAWLLHRITGVLLIIFLISHFYLMHYTEPSSYSAENVLARLSSPFWKFYYFVFLIAGLYHGGYGIYGLFNEYIKSPALRKFLQGALICLGFYLLVYGSYTIFFIK